jgi:hypothetical protein
LRFSTREASARRGEPVTVGLPWPKGAVKDERCFRLVSTWETGSTENPVGHVSNVPLQTRVLDRWGDGSIRWCLFDFFANGNEAIAVGEPRPIDCPAAWNELPNDASFPLPFYTPDTRRLETGPVRESYECRDIAKSPQDGYEITAHIDRFFGLSTYRIQLTVTNPRPSDHPNGNWDLGNAGHAVLKRCVVTMERPSGPCRISVIPGQAFVETKSIALRQHSSGGDHWDSRNHIDKNHELTVAERGYRLTTDADENIGDRATPIVGAGHGADFRGIAMPEFWENFPKALEATAESLSLELFPEGTELQGGERKTHTFYLSFGQDTITDEPMVWCRSPMTVHADPEWYAASGAMPYLTPSATDPHADYLSLVRQALDGPDTFEAKREKIDEYGWRHFGDIYGDHEAVKHTGPTPMISHYNNQYDCVQAFLIQFMRSGDVRWLEQGRQCADHTIDIDVYHTTGDKAAYNGGLFWHTYHYVDADTGTHRSYPKSLRKGPNVNQTERVDQLAKTAEKLQKAYAVGGGPSASHNYNAGLATMYFLTGDERYRETAVDLADFVIRMEDPRTTPFRFLSREFTGLATDSGGGGYHGPGRASATSIMALVVGHRLTGESRFLEKAEQLIRRVSSPNQDLAKLDLLNAELRWFYTMHLQALGVYLDHKIDIGQMDDAYAYARATLLHYADWMAANERPILDTPERLQFPTETWAAQDLRKVEVFQFAAKHATGERKVKYLERAEWFFHTSVAELHTFPTKSLCRPVILAMKYGWTRNWWRQNASHAALEPARPLGPVPLWTMFVPQRQIAMKRAKRIAVAGAVAFMLLLALAVVWLLSR